ncbi:MAG: hypothetical protein IEMM0002_1339 [bacterium]|nr:MAG: hypothetical protein IEMM0002_1339 [bacterium]
MVNLSNHDNGKVILHVYPAKLKADQVLGAFFPRDGSGVLLSRSITTVSNFENKLIAELVPHHPVGDVERWLLLHDAVAAEKHFKKDPALSALPQSEGFIHAVGDLIQQIKLGLVTDADLDSISGFARGKEEWVKKIFHRYNRSLRKGGLTDTADAGMALIEKLGAIDRPPRTLAGFDEIHFHDIFHFTPLRFELIRRLGLMKKVVIHFPLPDDRRKVFDFVERNIQKFQSMEDAAGEIELSFSQKMLKPENPLNLFTSILFDDEKIEPLESDLDGSVEIIKNSGRYREIEEAAQRIRQLKGERKWSDFCLVFRGLEKYGAIVEDVFRRAEIPVYLKRGIPVRANPYVKTILGVFRVIETDFDRDEVVKLAASQYFSLLPDSLHTHELENRIIDAGIISGSLSYWKKRLAAVRKRSKTDKNLNIATDRVVKLLASIEKFSKAVRAGDCLKTFSAIITKLLAPRSLKVSQSFYIRDYYCRARFETVMDEMKSSLAGHSLQNSPFAWHDLKKLLLGALGNVHTPDWSNRNHVYVLTTNELAGLKFPFIFICGLHDGEFPRRVQTGSLLTEHEKSKFNKRHAETILAETPQCRRGRQIFSRLGESWDEESFLFYLAARSASVKLILSYGTHELNGEELNRSSFMEETSAMFPNLKETTTPAVALGKEYHEQLDNGARETKLLYDLFQKEADDAGGLRDYFINCINNKNSGRSFWLSCEKSRIELERLKFYSEFDPEERARNSTSYTGRINGGAALAMFFKKIGKRAYSPTELEKYAGCPFRYFLSKPLGCEPLKLPRAEPERTTQGSIIHDVLDRYYSGLKADPERPRLPAFETALEKMKKCAAQVFEKWEKKGQTGYERLWEITKEKTLAALELFLKNEQRLFEEEPFSVIETELEFGARDNRLTINLDGEVIGLEGRIDRVDYIPRRKLLRVVDYKNTTNISKYRKLLLSEKYCIESFQVPIYLFAALSDRFIHHHHDKNPQPRGAYGAYYGLKNEPKLSTRQKKPAPFDDVRDAKMLLDIAGSQEFGGRILGQVLRMESGDFSVTPTDCMFCDYRRVCRYIEVRKPDVHE